MKLSVVLPKPGVLAAAGRAELLRLRRANQVAVHEATQKAYRRVQAEIVAAGLGKLSKGVGVQTSLRKGTTDPNFAWGVLYAKGKDGNRTEQALEAYSEGATIVAKRQWLAFPTPAMKRISGFGAARERVSPGNYDRLGFTRRIGPLQFKKVSPSRAIWFVNGVDIQRKNGLAIARGKRRSKLRTPVRIQSLFIGIKITTRGQRFDQRRAVAFQSGRVPGYITAILRQQRGR